MDLDAKQEEVAHSLLGASAAARWLNCPGSFALSRQAPPSRSSIYAATGTLAHEVIERSLKLVLAETGSLASIIDLDLDQLRGGTYQRAGHDITIDDDFIEGVRVMLDYVTEVAPRFNMMRCELTVFLDSYFKDRKPPPVKLFGRTDIVLLADGLLEIIDYKNGSGVLVSPEDNAQLYYYAAGTLALVRSRWPALTVDQLRLTVCQPHARGLAKVRSADIDVVDLLIWVDDVLIPGVEACTAPDAPLVPGSWCRFCPASFMCPALIAEANEMAKRDFDDRPAFSLTDPAELSRQLDVALRAEAWINAIRAYALQRLQRQEHIPNWGLVPTRPMRRWRDEFAVAAVLNEALPLEDVFEPPKLKSPAQIEKVIRKKLNTRTWDECFAPLVDSVSSGVKLNRENDPFEGLDDVDSR